MALAILLPVFAEYGHLPGFEASPAFLVGAAAGAIVLLEGLQVLNKWQENWILYRATCENLRNEQHLFAETAGPYAGLKPDAPQQAARRADQPPSHGRTFQVVARHEHKVETTGAF